MEIKTKYNIGDEVYALHDGKVVSFNIDRIEVTISKHYSPSIIYETFGLEDTFRQCFSEERLFSSKEDLLESFVIDNL